MFLGEFESPFSLVKFGLGFLVLVLVAYLIDFIRGVWFLSIIKTLE